MSMYNMLFGVSPIAADAVHAAGLRRRDLGRYRDAWFDRDSAGEPVVVVHTRNGGGNREHWDWEGSGYTEAAGPSCRCPGCVVTFAKARFPTFLSDTDDGFDSTYANMVFSVLPEWRDRALALLQVHLPLNTQERWKEAIEAMKRGDPEIMEKCKPLVAQLTEAIKRVESGEGGGVNIVEV